MVILPGCACCPPDCQTQFALLKSSSTVSIKVNASDYLKKIRSTGIYRPVYCNNALHTAVTLFCAGSEYAGTFSLTKVSETQNSALWQYLYPDSSFRCSGRGIFVEISVNKYFPLATHVIHVTLTLTHFQHRDYASETYRSKQDFSCATAQAQLCSQPELKQNYGATLRYVSSCANGVFEIASPTPNMSWSDPTVSITGDEKGPTSFLTTIEENGSRNVNFSDIEFVP